jgi:hypothetical protein
MRNHVTGIAACLVLGLATWALASSRPARRDNGKDKDTRTKHAQKAQKVKLTHGPVIESMKPVTVAWSTNVNASTILKYGTNPGDLDQTAEARWGGRTHRVYLHNLKPGTTYYYRVESTQAQGSGTQVVSGTEHFRTPAATASTATPANAANASHRQTALRNFHQFLATHPNVRADLQKDPNLARNGRYAVQHPDFSRFLQGHPFAKQYLAQNPKSFLQSEETMR